MGQAARDELYSYPYAIAQQTGVFRVEAAFLRRIALPHAGRLTLRPSVTLLTGSGTEERLTREENNAEVEMNSYRNYERVSSSFAALTRHPACVSACKQSTAATRSLGRRRTAA